jgi:5-methylcytosine-specific restriction endonuclease McrA
MEKQKIKIIKKIVNEYTGFMRKTSGLIDEVKRATVLSLKNILKLEDGELIIINDDGSLEVETKISYKENAMSEEKGDNKDKVILNGWEVSLEELQRQREAIQNQKGARLEEVSKDNFRLRLND